MMWLIYSLALACLVGVVIWFIVVLAMSNNSDKARGADLGTDARSVTPSPASQYYYKIFSARGRRHILRISDDANGQISTCAAATESQDEQTNLQIAIDGNGNVTFNQLGNSGIKNYGLATFRIPQGMFVYYILKDQDEYFSRSGYLMPSSYNPGLRIPWGDYGDCNSRYYLTFSIFYGEYVPAMPPVPVVGPLPGTMQQTTWAVQPVPTVGPLPGTMQQTTWPVQPVPTVGPLPGTMQQPAISAGWM